MLVYFSTTRFFSWHFLTIPWLLTTSLTFPWRFKFPDISRFSRQVVTQYKTNFITASNASKVHSGKHKGNYATTQQSVVAETLAHSVSRCSTIADSCRNMTMTTSSNDPDFHSESTSTLNPTNSVTTPLVHRLQLSAADVVVAVVLLCTGVGWPTARRSHDIADDIRARTRRTAGPARARPQSVPHAPVPPDSWRTRGSMPSAGMAHTCCPGTGFWTL